jgi:hypothetical protein
MPSVPPASVAAPAAALSAPESQASVGDDDVRDTVILKTGGRVRGAIQTDDAQRGITIKVPPGGTITTIPPWKIDRVQYGARGSR